MSGTLYTLTDALKSSKELGATFAVNDSGKLLVNFGEAHAPTALLDSLKVHREDLIRLYAHTAPGYQPPAAPQPKPAPPPLIGHDALTGHTEPVPSVAFEWWNAGDTLAGNVCGMDTETVRIEDNSPGAEAPDMVIATVTDGVKGFYLQPADILPFLDAHTDALFVFHNIAFDAKVLEKVAKNHAGSFFKLVDENRIGCTMEMERMLNLAAKGNAKIYPSLSDLAEKYCGAAVEKDAVDADGDTIRTSFGKWLGKSREDISQNYLDYASGDTVVTLSIWKAQQRAAADAAELAKTAYGYPGDDALKKAWGTYGPLTVFVQVRAAIVCEVMSSLGVHFDITRRDDVLKTLAADKAKSSKALREHGLYVPYDPDAEAETLPAWEAELLPKKGPSLRSQITKHMEAREEELLESGDLEEPFKRTDTGRLSLDKEARVGWLKKFPDPVLVEYARYEQAQKWMATYAEKMASEWVHPKWNHGLNTGRFSCTGAIALQTMPKCITVEKDRTTLRQCITAGENRVFLAADYSQIELVALAAAMQYQTGYGHALADVIRRGIDVHTAIAIQMFGDRIGPVSPSERKAVKPVSFGLPGAMGAKTLKKVALNNYGIDLTEGEVQFRIDAYKSLAPEMNQHLSTEVNAGQRAASLTGLHDSIQGNTMLMVLAGETRYRSGTPISEDCIGQMWGVARRLTPHLRAGSKKMAKWADDIEHQKASKQLAAGVKAAVSAEMSCTMTGRVRARCTFAAARNNVFQGPTADGGILALWRLMRMGYQIAMFVHDELVISIKDDNKGHHHAEIISRVMVEEMSRVLHGMPVKVEWFVSRSFSARDKFDPAAQLVQQQSREAGKAAPVVVKGPAERKKRDKQQGANKQAQKTWKQKGADNDFDDGDLPF